MGSTDGQTEAYHEEQLMGNSYEACQLLQCFSL